MNLFILLTIALQLTTQADILREDGQSVEAINKYNQAIVQFQKESDVQGMMLALTGRLLSWKHLFYETEEPLYAIFVKNQALEMQEIADAYHIKDKQYLTSYLLAESFSLLKDYAASEKAFQKAVDLFPEDNGEKGDWMAHLGTAMVLNGKKEQGLAMIHAGILKIESNQATIDPFLYNVWLSGAYLRLAKLTGSPLDLLKAQEIINSDPKLVIRKRQLESWIKQSKN